MIQCNYFTLLLPWNGHTRRRGFGYWGYIITLVIVCLGLSPFKPIYGLVMGSFDRSRSVIFQTLWQHRCSSDFSELLIYMTIRPTLRHSFFPVVRFDLCIFILYLKSIIISYKQVINTVCLVKILLLLFSLIILIPTHPWWKCWKDIVILIRFYLFKYFYLFYL